jgi:hypothetical protein
VDGSRREIDDLRPLVPDRRGQSARGVERSPRPRQSIAVSPDGSRDIVVAVPRSTG